MQHKIVIADCDHETIDIEREIFRQNGYDCDWRKCISEDEIIAGCADASVLLVQYGKITRRVMTALPNLKQVVRYGVGFDTVDITAARQCGVEVCNIPDYGTNEVADHAVAHTLWLHRKLYLVNNNIRQGQWNYIDAIPIHRMNTLVVGIIGLGRIGKCYAARMRAFGVTIIAADDKAHNIPDYVTMVSFNQLLERSDIISIHCPADGNKDLLGAKEFNAMKDGAILINVARGGIVNEDALNDALVSKKLAGCGLDVASNEPLHKDNPLLQHDNVTVSPHMAWYSEEAAEEAVRFVKGEAVHYSVTRLGS